MLDEPTTMKSTSLADREGEEFALFDIFSPGLLGLEFVLFWRDFCVVAVSFSILDLRDLPRKVSPTVNFGLITCGSLQLAI